MARFQAQYREKVVPDLMKQFGYQSVMEVPRITKITLNMGVGEAVGDKKILDHAVGDMIKIAGQKPVVTKAKKAIAKAFQCQLDGRGFSLVEILSPCPVNWKMTPLDACKWIDEVMVKQFPLGVVKDATGVAADTAATAAAAIGGAEAASC